MLQIHNLSKEEVKLI